MLCILSRESSRAPWAYSFVGLAGRYSSLPGTWFPAVPPSHPLSPAGPSPNEDFLQCLLLVLRSWLLPSLENLEFGRDTGLKYCGTQDNSLHFPRSPRIPCVPSPTRRTAALSPLVVSTRRCSQPFPFASGENDFPPLAQDSPGVLHTLQVAAWTPVPTLPLPPAWKSRDSVNPRATATQSL